ncbi:MAG TPA: S49 family peptidase [Pseudoxanthomonas sp.]
MSKPGLLSRLIGRSNHPVVSSLATATLNRSLLAHPAMAESIIGGYLTGKITSADTQLQATFVVAGSALNGASLIAAEPLDIDPADPKPEADTTARVGVINISGGLVNRPMPGASGEGPCSYTAIRDAFDAMIEDDSVSAIVLRLESPGGMASGCFDLTDHIFESRGRKPIHALVDDYAFSAAFAIAASCEEIWVSRTGGVGSVGVCCFHNDWSSANEKMGLKVTAIYAGKHKIDFSADFPLREGAQSWLQQHVDADYQMFVEAVARYRGLDAEAVKETEAQCYFGRAGIDVGFATRLGTWDDLMAHLDAQAAEDPDHAGAGDSGGVGATAATAANDDASVAAEAIGAVEQLSTELNAIQGESSEHARAVAIDAIVSAKLPAAVALAMIETTPHDGGDVDARLAHAQQVIDLCSTAKSPERAAEFVRSGADIAQVRSALVDGQAMVDTKVTLNTSLPQIHGAASKGAVTLHESTYSRRRDAAATTGT